MQHGNIKKWLQQKRRKLICWHGILSVLLLVGGLLVLTMTYGVILCVVYYVLHVFVPTYTGYATYVSIGVLVLLFYGQQTTDRAYLSRYSVTTGTAHDEPVTIGMKYSTINPIAPDTAHSYVKMITSVLYTGPRMIAALWYHSWRTYSVITMDQSTCASILQELMEHDDHVPVEELVREHPQTNQISESLELVRQLDGVLYLKEEGPALRLTASLRDELNEFGNNSIIDS